MDDNEQVVTPTDDAAPSEAAPSGDGAHPAGADDTQAAGAGAGDARAAGADAGGGLPADGAAGDAAPAAASPDEAAGPKAPRPRREKPRRDPHEPTYGGVFLDALQRCAGLRGQFSYGVPAKLWRANREVMIRILREEVPMPTYKNQIQCVLHEDPELLAWDVHYEMLSSAVPPEDSFRWLWLFMMLR